jgi:hypothetical protein
VLAEDLARDLERGTSNLRVDYRTELRKYVQRLPSPGDDGNILLADAAARTLRAMFAAEVDIISAPIAAHLRTLLEHHIGLRPYYPEIDIFYRDVRSGRLQKPLPIDAFASVVRGVEANTPEIFDPSVIAAMDQGAEPGPIIVPVEDPPESTNQPTPPPDPLGDLDPAKAHDLQAAGIVNKLWQVFTAGETVHKAAGAWRATYDALAPPVGQILDWLRQFLPAG